MRVAFLRPSLDGRRAHDAMEPLAFAALAAVSPDGTRHSLHDERLAPIPPGLRPDLAAITVETYTARRAYQIADGLRARGVPVVMGGYHPTFLPDEAARHADAVVIGDGEPVWADVVRDAAAGRLRPRYQADGFPDLADLRFDRSIFREMRYQNVLPVQVGRGCRFACDFCSIHAFYGRSLRQRPPQAVADEIRRSGARHVLLVDDNLLVDREQAAALFEALVPLGITWGCQVTLDVTHDAELLDLMARSGCIAALVGFESLDDGNLGQMRKRFNTVGGPYSEAIARFHARGIMVYGSFVFGYDHDGPDCFERTARFALDHRLFLVNFSALQPTPATRLYDRLAAEGRLLHDAWWTDPAYRYGDAAFRPANLTPDALTAGCRRARRLFFRPQSILRRAWNRPHRRSPARLAVYLGANVMARRALKDKLGKPLGEVQGSKVQGSRELTPCEP
ncbi:B12-binding domain-containing radical SAM protein [Rubrivirga sp.]|uniref:B12-binding domain-containing radical SAM protein n=1 Tax=Rubrivirga sp. TaxID=1885344 RepID=UPI003B523B1D